MITGVLKRSAFDMPSAIPEVRPATERVLAFLAPLGLDASVLFDVRLCLEESLINAVKYGNREKREVPVRVEAAYSDREIFLAVEDRGPGFDPARVQDPTDGGNLEAQSGRGVFLIRHLMDRVEYNARGNRVEMVKVYKKHARV
jgi:serine/threonine-protein kinase RsbW